MRIRVSILVLLASAALAAFVMPALAAKDDSLDQLGARADAARPEDRPALYLEIARQQAEEADKLYQAGDAEKGNSALREVVTFSKKATDASIETGKKLKNT